MQAAGSPCPSESMTKNGHPLFVSYMIVLLITIVHYSLYATPFLCLVKSWINRPTTPTTPFHLAPARTLRLQSPRLHLVEPRHLACGPSCARLYERRGARIGPRALAVMGAEKRDAGVSGSPRIVFIAKRVRGGLQRIISVSGQAERIVERARRWRRR